jgi:protein-disulfide isomerase
VIRLRTLLFGIGLLLTLAGCTPESPAPRQAPAEPGVTARAEDAVAAGSAENSSAETEPAAEESATDESTPVTTSATAALVPTATSASEAPTPPAAPADWGAVATVEGDYIILGNPAAPIRLIDYSDFM